MPLLKPKIHWKRGVLHNLPIDWFWTLKQMKLHFIICSDVAHVWCLSTVLAHPSEQGSWGQHGAHLGPTGPRWAPWILLSGTVWTWAQIQNYLLPNGSLGPTSHDHHGSQSTGNGSHHWCFYSLEILRCITRTQVVKQLMSPFRILMGRWCSQWFWNPCIQGSFWVWAQPMKDVTL